MAVESNAAPCRASLLRWSTSSPQCRRYQLLATMPGSCPFLCASMRLLEKEGHVRNKDVYDYAEACQRTLQLRPARSLPKDSRQGTASPRSPSLRRGRSGRARCPVRPGIDGAA
eukprot:scaffold803_cov310-Pinguiococcus_pyrenoidosus.AAC.123